MASAASQSGLSLSEHLLSETAELRERFERNPLFSRMFADMVEARAYRRLLIGFYGYYHLLETLIRSRESGKLTGAVEIRLNKTAWIEQDLKELGSIPGSPAPLLHLPRIRTPSDAVGAAFVTEYIAWHSEVAEKHLGLALPRSCREAVHFVTAYGRSREMQWQRFCLWLDQQSLTEREEMAIIRTARKTLAGMDAWLRDVMHDS